MRPHLTRRNLMNRTVARFALAAVIAVPTLAVAPPAVAHNAAESYCEERGSHTHRLASGRIRYTMRHVGSFDRAGIHYHRVKEVYPWFRDVQRVFRCSRHGVQPPTVPQGGVFE